MKGFIRIICAFLFSTFATLSDAHTANLNCPSASEIWSRPFNSVSCPPSGLCLVGQNTSRYDTLVYWDFTMYVPEKTIEVALAKAKEALPSLNFQEGPIVIKQGVWKCIYTDMFGRLSLAIHRAE